MRLLYWKTNCTISFDLNFSRLDCVTALRWHTAPPGKYVCCKGFREPSLNALRTATTTSLTKRVSLPTSAKPLVRRAAAGSTAALVAALVSAPMAAQEPVTSDETKSVRIQRAAAPPVIDGVLDEETWQRAPVIDDFHQVNPVEFAAPSERTEVLVLYDRDALYIGVRLYDSEPNLINARILSQGQAIGSDDRFFVHIDPFNTRRSGYLFGVNPNGVRYDGIFEGVTQRQFDWDGIWQAAANVTPDGWVLEIAIPFKTLSFDPMAANWRM